eukprot:11467820-Alexandrium_andersonii.AAC.1
MGMLVWPNEESNRGTQLRKEARAIRRARQTAAKQELLCKVQEQKQTIWALTRKLHEWEEWHDINQKPRHKKRSEVETPMQNKNDTYRAPDLLRHREIIDDLAQQ